MRRTLKLVIALALVAVTACALGADSATGKLNFKALTRSFKHIGAATADAKAAPTFAATSTLAAFAGVPSGLPLSAVGAQDLNANRQGVQGTVKADMDDDTTAEDVKFFTDSAGTTFFAYHHSYLSTNGEWCLAWLQGDKAYLVVVGSTTSLAATVCSGAATDTTPTCGDCTALGCGKSCGVDNLGDCTSAPGYADAGPAACQDQCSAGAVTCDGIRQVVRCADPTVDMPCRVWAAAEVCSVGCSPGTGCY